MARAAGITVENSFVKGLITEATGLNFPENACKETYDCVFSHTGEVYRRPALAFEEDYDTYVATTDNAAITEFLWQGVAQNGEISFAVLQIGNTISFFRANTEQALSSASEPFTIDITDHKVSTAPETKSIACSFSTGNGYLFVAHPYCTTFYVSYDENTDTFSVGTIDIQIRDFEGVDNKNSSGSIIETDHRPTTAEITSSIKYNLFNQGWYSESPVTVAGFSPQSHDYIINVMEAFLNGLQGTTYTASWDTLFSNTRGLGVYPSEADIWWSYKRPKATSFAGNPVNVQGASEGFDLSELNTSKYGNTPAPKGHYIYSAFNIDRSAKTGFTGIPKVTSGYQRPSQIAFYAGRIFYAGVDSLGYNTKIYFSQILEGSKNVNIGKCYQKQDPTSEETSDPLPTDGGVIEIPDIAKVIKLFPVTNALYVFANNGIWRISGSEGVGFTALDYSVAKISSTNASSATSFVDVDGLPIWWNTDGIWTLQQSSEIAVPQVVSLTNNSIKSFFSDIPIVSRYYAKGNFNPFTRIVQWLYRSTEGSDHYEYDRILNLDMTTGAFYPWRIPTTNNLAGILSVKGAAVDFVPEDVTVGGEVVTVGSESVTVEIPIRSLITSSDFKYVTILPTGITFSEFVEDVYSDWKDTDNESDYTSYFISGYKIRGEGIRKFQSNYIRLFMEHGSVFDFHAGWDFANTGNKSRFSQTQRVSANVTELDYNSRKLKIRGNGVALNLYVSSVSGNPFNIIGWSSFETANQQP